ncbi:MULTISPECIES: 2'-5' RNA ligase family protein [Methylobacterium]|uniref:2'-5' RNA ligase family protein n=1 Tax=Methylobacterium TaxID=407 RepID=UPI00104CFBA5|nr:MULTISPECIES: 2'-5' RNA ligase family protein [Methylobacterium]MDR7037718.1 2'-5' RNA ligase [Methylobacterium sp. BE186]
MHRPGDPSDPLILTLELDAETFARFDGLRRRHFPERLNHIPAHVTLFHHLPGPEERGVTETVAALVRTVAPPEVAVTGLRFLGRGVAFNLESEALSGLRARLARAFEGHLTAQDRQGFRPHVTVQNKVEPEVARALQAGLEQDFRPFRFTAPGLILWRYLGGPWEERARFAFGAFS